MDTTERHRWVVIPISIIRNGETLRMSLVKWNVDITMESVPVR